MRTPPRTARGLVAALALALAAPAAGAGDADCAAALAERVQRRYEDVRDLAARFEQTTERVALGGAGQALVARGSVQFAKPGRMRWSYETPEPSLVVSDGETLWIYDPKAREVQKLPLGSGPLTAAGLQFLLGEGRLRDTFAVTARGCGGDTVELVLTPREPASYERLELRVVAATGVVEGTTVVDLFGNRTAVAFEGLRENTDPDAALFRFAPPAGVRVLSLPEAP